MFALFDKLLGREKPGPEKKPVAAAPRAGAAPAAPKQSAAPDLFEISHEDLLQKMWGQGFSSPGDASFIKDVAGPLALDSQKSMLDLSAGLGGAARALVDAFKTYVTGFERDEALAIHGNKLSAMTGHGRSAPVNHYDPRTFSYEKKADAILVRDVLYTFPDKDAFMVRVASVMKPRGHMIMCDFTCEEDHLDNPAVREWIKGEPYGVHLMSALQQSQMIAKHGFDVRINANISKDYSKAVLAGLARLAHFLEGRKLSPATKVMVAREVDFWARRLMALEAGLTYTRYYAIKTS